PSSVPRPIRYPFPPLMTPPAGGLLPRAGEGVPFSTRPPRAGYTGSYFYPPFGYADTTTSVDTTGARLAAPVPTTGLLPLAVTPLSAEVVIGSLHFRTLPPPN